MTLPIELQAVITAALVFLVTEGLKVVAEWIGQDLQGVGAVIAAALSTAVIAFLNGLLGAVPLEYAPAVQAALAVLVALLSAFGIHRVKQGI